ncbi:hypothetical protein TB1_026015 [Malus domestica]
MATSSSSNQENPETKKVQFLFVVHKAVSTAMNSTIVIIKSILTNHKPILLALRLYFFFPTPKLFLCIDHSPLTTVFGWLSRSCPLVHCNP